MDVLKNEFLIRPTCFLPICLLYTTEHLDNNAVAQFQWELSILDAFFAVQFGAFWLKTQVISVQKPDFF